MRHNPFALLALLQDPPSHRRDDWLTLMSHYINGLEINRLVDLGQFSDARALHNHLYLPLASQFAHDINSDLDCGFTLYEIGQQILTMNWLPLLNAAQHPPETRHA